MQFLKSPKFIIFLILFVNFLGYGIVFPILPLLTEQYGGDPIISGLLIGVFSLMQLISTPVLGSLSDRFGRRPLLLFSLWGTVLSFAIMGFTHSIFWLMVARIIDGISGGNVSIAQAYIADVTDRKNRAAGMGILAAGISLGFILGPIWGGLFARISLSAPFIAATILTVISAVLTHLFLPESESSQELEYEKKNFNFKHLIFSLEQRPLFLLFVIFLLLFWAQSGVFTTISLFGKDVLKISLTQISLIFAFGGVISALIQGYAVGKVVKFISEEKLLLISSISTAAGFAVMSVAGNIILFFLGVTIFNIGSSFIVPIVNALVSEKSSPHEQGGNMGLVQSFGSAGRLIGPIMAGFVYEKISPFSPAMMGVVIMLFISIISFRTVISAARNSTE